MRNENEINNIINKVKNVYIPKFGNAQNRFINSGISNRTKTENKGRNMDTLSCGSSY